MQEEISKPMDFILHLHAGQFPCHHPEADNSSVHICDEILDIGTTEVEHFLQAFDAVLENTDL